MKRIMSLSMVLFLSLLILPVFAIVQAAEPRGFSDHPRDEAHTAFDLTVVAASASVADVAVEAVAGHQALCQARRRRPSGRRVSGRRGGDE